MSELRTLHVRSAARTPGAHDIFITKADGTQEPYDASKLEASLLRAGAPPEARERIGRRIIEELRPGITTEEIYGHAFAMLRRDEDTSIAARYSVKRAVFALGPSGFPFEQFLAEVLRAHGWTTRTGITLTGRCATHEVDVLAEKDGKRIGIEAKFHNQPGGKTDVKDALYVKARYDDLRNAPDPSSHVDEGWLVTNTSFTKNAINYAQCSNLTLLAWDYPEKHNLLNMIEEARVHPLTCLTTLSEGEKRRLLESRVVLCKHVSAPHVLKEYGVKPERIPQVLEEAKRLCGV